MARTISKDYDTKRRHILKVAAEVFALQGIERASMNEVAKACGISKANIYHYYSSKNDLVFDILDSYLSELRQLMCDVDRSKLDPETKLRSITQDFLLAYKGMDNEHKIQSEGLPYLEPQRQQTLKDYQRDLVELVSSVLKECSPGILGENANECRNVTMAVFGMLNWFYMWSPKTTAKTRREYAASIANLTLNGILKG